MQGRQQTSPQIQCRNSNWVKAGNLLEKGADFGGKASFYADLGGAAIAAGGFVSGQPEAVALGGSLMKAAGWAGTVAVGMQIGGGVLQVVGGQSNAGWSNIWNGGASLLAGSIFGAIGGMAQQSGYSVASGMFNSKVDAVVGFGGLALNAVPAKSPGMTPALAGCPN